MNSTLRIKHHVRPQHKAGATALLTGRHLQNITTVFRAVEFLLFLVVISRFSFMLPVALKLSGDYFRDLAVTLVSPRFIFVVGNAIVITLFVKSGGKFSHSSHTPENYTAACTTPAPPPETTFIVSVYSSSTKTAAKTATKTFVAGNSPAAAEVKINCYRRSKSEKLYVKRAEKPVAEKNSGGGAKVLRRTKTEAMERHVGCTCQGHYPEDHMSSEEFRRTIEDFIARQQRFLREEEEDEILALAG